MPLKFCFWGTQSPALEVCGGVSFLTLSGKTLVRVFSLLRTHNFNGCPRPQKGAVWRSSNCKAAWQNFVDKYHVNTEIMKGSPAQEGHYT